MSAPSTRTLSVPRAHAAVGNAVKSAKGDRTAPAVVEARQTLAEAKIAQFIERTVAAAPPLTPEAKARLAAVLQRTPEVAAR